LALSELANDAFGEATIAILFEDFLKDLLNREIVFIKQRHNLSILVFTFGAVSMASTSTVKTNNRI